jgi:hypothetical protein
MNNIASMIDTSDVPSLSASGMLVEFSASTWGNNRQDKEASRQLAQLNGADMGSVSASKKLIDHPSLDKINKVTREIRRCLYKWTVKWSDFNSYLPAPHYIPCMDEYTELAKRHSEYCEEFFEAYEFQMAGAQGRLGAMFKWSDYPSIEEIRNRFGLRLNVFPVPESGDYRVDIANEQKEAIKSKFAEFYENKLREIATDVYTQVATSVDHMVDTLTRYTQKKRDGELTKLNSSLIDNMLHLLTTMRGFNVTNDPEIERIRMDMEDAVRGLTIDQLKVSEVTRLQTIDKFKAIKATLPTLDI